MGNTQQTTTRGDNGCFVPAWRLTRVGAAALVLALVGVLPGVADAQGEARTDEPGVVEDVEDVRQQLDDGQVDDDDIAAAQREGNVITPDDVNPHERYDLPPNFDPGFEPQNIPRNTRVTIDFREADLEEVVRFFSGVMNINFIVADSLAADRSITIISPQEVSIEEAYRAFMSALEMNGLTVVPHGEFLKIIEADQAITEPMVPYEMEDDIPDESRMVTGIIPVENAGVDEIEEIISNFTTDNATILRYHSSLIITENASNLNRIRALVERLDEGGARSNHYVYQVRYADATDIEEQLREIFDEEDEAEDRDARDRRRRRRRDRRDEEEVEPEQADEMQVRIEQMVADERTNQLIIVANERSFERIREMIEILDVETAVGGEVHVQFLEYANAEELSQTMSQLETGGGGRDEEGGVASLLQGEVQITAHEPANALVVVASPRDFLALEQVINELDRPQRQVYVEAVIMEVGMDVDRRLDLGVTSGVSTDLDFLIPDSAVEDGLVDDTRGIGFGGANFPGIEGLDMAEGLGLGLLGPSVQLPGTEISLPAFALMLQAAQTDDSVNVLSTPSILTMDNEEAEIIVGERVPIARGIPGQGGGGGLGDLLGLGALGGGLSGGVDELMQGQRMDDASAGRTTGQRGGIGDLGGLGGLGGLLGSGIGTTPVTYEDVGIELRIVPQINESDYVRLEVDQEISDLAGAGLHPIRTRRNAQTTVLVRDQSTIVIGGLMRDQERETVEKVPFLGDIPVVGMLFRNQSVTTQKQNLVLMLTPYIVENEQDLQGIYDRKMEEREEVMQLFARQEREYHRHVDYNKKTGLLDRMRAEIGEARLEEEAREEALQEFEEHGPRYQILGGGAAEEQPDEQPAEPVPAPDTRRDHGDIEVDGHQPDEQTDAEDVETDEDGDDEEQDGEQPEDGNEQTEDDQE